MEAIRNLQSTGFRPLRTVYLSFVPDEEISGHDGAEKFALSDVFKNMNVGVVLDEGLSSPTESYRVFYGERSPWFLMFIHFGPIRIATFYKFQCSESHFLNTVVPNLKNSFSISLNHFAPFAGKILIPHKNSVPVSHFAVGDDSVHLSIAISITDFDHLTANHSVETHRILNLSPHLFPASSLNYSTVKLPVTSFQVTLFPGKGVCIGLTGNHSVCDAVTLITFFQVWVSINRESSSDLSECLLTFDRNIVADGDRFAVKFWDAIKPYQWATTILPDPSSVLATFVLSEAGIKTLRRLRGSMVLGGLDSKKLGVLRFRVLAG